MRIFLIAKDGNIFKIKKYVENNAVLYAVSRESIQIVDDPVGCDAFIFDEENIASAKD